MSEQQNDGPQWVPYQPPPPSGGERVWATVRRVAFPVILLLFVAGLGGMLYLTSGPGTNVNALRELVGLEPVAPASATRGTPPATSSGTTSAGEAAGRSPSDLGSGGGASGGQLGTGYANLSVFSEPAGAAVLVDGDSVGATPLNRYPIRSGVYIITVEQEGFFSSDTVAVLRNNQAPTYSVALNPRPELPADESPTVAEERPDTPTASPSADATEPASSDPEPTPDPPPTAEPAPTTGTLRFDSDPAGAQVQLDGSVVGTTPLTLDGIDAGLRTVRITRAGYDTTQTQVAVVAGEVQTVQASLERLMGRLRVLVRPWGSIYINGELRERNADVWFETAVPAGEYEVSAVHPALGQQVRTVTVAPGEQISTVIDLRDS